MSWTQLVAAWGMEIGLSAPVAGTLGVVAGVMGPVLVISLVMGGLEAWAASMRRANPRGSSAQAAGPCHRPVCAPSHREPTPPGTCAPSRLR